MKSSNKDKLLDDKIEALIYELCPNTSRAWIFDEGIPEKLRILIRTATLDEVKEALANSKTGISIREHAIEIVDNLRGNDE